MAQSTSGSGEADRGFIQGPRVVTDVELEAVDKAVESAIERDLYDLGAQLSIEQAIALEWRYQFGAALAYAEIALDAWREHLDRLRASGTRLATEDSTELRIRGLCAIQAFRLLYPDVAIAHLSAADRLGRDIPPSLVTAELAWTRSLCEQWRNAPGVALAFALRALATYVELGSAHEQCRIRLQAADIALDCAASSFASGLPQLADQYLMTARPLIELDDLPTEFTNVELVELQARLAYARYSLLIGVNEDRLPLIESILARALSLDAALVGHGWMALGDEFAAEPDAEEEARTCYRLAVSVLERCHTPAFAARPRRRLALLEEVRSLRG